jgi:AmmeMemoRadiSam system protein A
MSAPSWSPHQRQILSRLVWQSIEAGLREQQAGGPLRADGQHGAPRIEIPDELWLHRPAATFVTLEHHGMLRGCVGALEAVTSLADSVVHNAHSAAFADPRFAPLNRSELPGLTAEISILTALRPLAVHSWQALVSALQPGRDGVVVRCDGHSATFLPAVWEDLPDPALFLDQLWRKAGMVPRYWDDSMRIWTYQADKFAAERPLWTAHPSVPR